MSHKVLSDFELMELALFEAKKANRKDVHPNPRVGSAAQLVSGEVFVGHHAQYGKEHAEQSVLSQIAESGLLVEGARFAVTLEPCSFIGKTPACAKLLLEAKVAKVITGCKDVDPRVSGRGIELLNSAGVEVVEGVLEDECAKLNRKWSFAHQRKRPYVYLKMATSMDGLWSSEKGESRWITGPEARARGMDLRHQVDGMITGAGTIRADNPKLNLRDENGKDLSAQNQVPLWVVSQNAKFEIESKQVSQKGRKVEVNSLERGLKVFLEELYLQMIYQVLVEAGPALSALFLSERLVDELWHFQAPKLLGGAGKRLSSFADGELPGIQWRRRELEFLGEDVLIKYGPAD